MKEKSKNMVINIPIIWLEAEVFKLLEKIEDLRVCVRSQTSRLYIENIH